MAMDRHLVIVIELVFESNLPNTDYVTHSDIFSNLIVTVTKKIGYS